MKLSCVLQCVAVCCSMCCRAWQCVVVCCSALQCVAVRYSALQCVAVCSVCCSVLQSDAECCNVCCRVEQRVEQLTLLSLPPKIASSQQPPSLPLHLALLHFRLALQCDVACFSAPEI